VSDDRFEQEEGKDEDVDAHKHHFKGNDEASTDESEDVEAHKHHFKGNDEPGSDDDSDDVEAHRKLTR
jgi:hypothetical protein